MACRRDPLFPNFGILRLRRSRGAVWTELVDHVIGLPEVHPEVMAFTLMIRRLRRDLGLGSRTHCHAPGCAICAAQTVAHYGGSDEELMALYMGSLNEVNLVLARAHMAQVAA